MMRRPIRHPRANRELRGLDWKEMGVFRFKLANKSARFRGASKVLEKIGRLSSRVSLR